MSISMSLMGRSSLRRSINSFLPSTSTLKSTTTKYPVVSWFQQQLQLPNTTDQRLAIAEHNHELQIRSQLYNMNVGMDGGSGTGTGSIVSGVDTGMGSSILEDMATWLISTLKRRKKKMNKHKLKKRRKKLRLKSNK